MTKHRLFLTIWSSVLLGLAFLSACSVPVEAELDQDLMGGDSPEAATTAFFDAFNEALRDPELVNEESRNAWAARLASYFTPSERVEQRVALNQMLDNFVARAANVGENQLFSIEIIYNGVRVTQEEENRANVRLIDGMLHYRRVAVAENGYRNVLIDEQQSLNTILGKREQAGFPLVRVGERWFLTER